MSEFVPTSNVVLGQSAESVDEALKLLAAKAVELGLSDDAEGVYEAYKAREAEGTTGMTGASPFLTPRATPSSGRHDRRQVLRGHRVGLHGQRARHVRHLHPDARR